MIPYPIYKPQLPVHSFDNKNVIERLKITTWLLLSSLFQSVTYLVQFWCITLLTLWVYLTFVFLSCDLSMLERRDSHYVGHLTGPPMLQEQELLHLPWISDHSASVWVRHLDSLQAAYRSFCCSGYLFMIPTSWNQQVKKMTFEQASDLECNQATHIGLYHWRLYLTLVMIRGK